MKTLSPRVYALDALRGFAILTMVLSGVIPYGVLPAWMYHAQIPPPSHQFNPELPGLTWVDLVFPLFLFALGAALPLALSRRLEKGTPMSKIILGVLERGFLLGFFAIFLQHVRPHSLHSSPTAPDWLVGLLGFGLMFALFTRFPERWNKYMRFSLRFGGWLAAILLLALLRYPNDGFFSLQRSNIILVVLTNVAVFGSLIWLLTRGNHWLRLGFMGILLAIRLAQPEAGWVHWLWHATPIPWIYKLYYLQYLLIVLPGTMVGDLVLDWMKQGESMPTEYRRWSNQRLLGITVLMGAFIILLLVGMQARWLWQTTLLAFGLCGLGYGLMAQPNTEMERLLKKLFIWGVYWLVLGLFFEPYEGGIKKDHPTVSYYFVTTGLSIFLLIAFTIVIDVWQKKSWLRLLIDNGQNPMIAYTGYAHFIWPILALTGLERWLLALTPTPWLGFLRGVGYTLILALLVSFFTRRKIFWRT